MIDGTAWFNWAVDNPTAAALLAGGAALGLVLFIILVRLSFAALGRRILVGLGLRKKVARESHWATAQDLAEYGLRPPVKRRWYDLRSSRS
jgi:hypothetical protein